MISFFEHSTSGWLTKMYSVKQNPDLPLVFTVQWPSSMPEWKEVRIKCSSFQLGGTILGVMVFSHQSKTTTRQMLNLCIPMMPFTPGPACLVWKASGMHRFNICLVVALSLSCNVKHPGTVLTCPNNFNCLIAWIRWFSASFLKIKSWWRYCTDIQWRSKSSISVHTHIFSWAPFTWYYLVWAARYGLPLLNPSKIWTRK